VNASKDGIRAAEKCMAGEIEHKTSALVPC
jgi:hypothetical protein